MVVGAGEGAAGPASRRSGIVSWWRRWWGDAGNRVDARLVLVVLFVFAPIIADNTAQTSSRYSLTAALAEDGTVDLSRYEAALSVDRAEVDGELRSDKAPGQPVLGVPFHLLARAAGAEPATHLRVRGNLGLWWQTLWSATVPFAVLVVLMRRTAARLVSDGALAVVIAIGFATPLLPHAVNLYGQVLAATLGFGAWLAVEGGSTDRCRLILAGLLGGSAIAVEYHAAIVVAVVGTYCLARSGRRGLWFVAGLVPPATVLAIYQWAAFGAPWRLPFGYFSGVIRGTSEGGLYWPGLQGFTELVAGRHGLLLASPVVLLGLAGAAVGVWTSVAWRRHAAVGLAIGLCYVALSAGWSGSIASEDPGPRYLLPSLPFLVVPLAGIWSRWRVLAWGTTVLGAATAFLASTTLILSPSETAPLRFGYERAIHGKFAPTLWSLALGRWGVVLYLLTVSGVAFLCLKPWRAPTTIKASNTDLT